MTPAEIRGALLSRPRDAFRLTLAGEAAGEPHNGRVAVACVIRNRVLADLGHDGRPDWWGEGYAPVCLCLWQFSCWWEETSPNSIRLFRLAERVLSNTLTPSDRAMLDPLSAIADGVMSGTIADPTLGATHYLTTALLKAAPPKWAKGRTPCQVIGHHAFFKDVG